MGLLLADQKGADMPCYVTGLSEVAHIRLHLQVFRARARNAFEKMKPLEFTPRLAPRKENQC